MKDFQRNFAKAVWLSYLGLTLGAVGGGMYVWPVITGESEVFYDLPALRAFWEDSSGILMFAGVLLSAASLQAAWFCLNFRGGPSEGLDRHGQEVMTRSMTVSGLTIIGAIFAWMVRGMF